MKKLFAILAVALMAVPVALMAIPMVSANSVGTGVGVDIQTEDFAPMVWDCGGRVVYDDNTEWGRASTGGQELTERNNNYAFEGEAIKWKVLAMDKNGVEKIQDVYGTAGDAQGAGNDIEVDCKRTNYKGDGKDAWGMNHDGDGGIDPSCNARIGEEKLHKFNPETMDYYSCTLTVESPDSMYGEYWVTVEAMDLDGLTGTMDENEYWFFNPVIQLDVKGDLTFSDVRPGTSSYSDTMTVGNDADAGSGVMLDMFIAGTDFYDSASSGAMCPTTNKLALSAFKYYAVNGAYSTRDDQEDDDNTYDPATQRHKDSEGYVNIQYGDHFDRTMYNEAEIIQANPINGGDLGYAANLLAPGAEMSLTFKLNLPEPCNGDFDTGSIYFFGEAV
jgi:hypothetical protein